MDHAQAIVGLIKNPEAYGRIWVRMYTPNNTYGESYDDGDLLAVTHHDVVHAEPQTQWNGSTPTHLPTVIRSQLLLVFGQRHDDVLANFKTQLASEVDAKTKLQMKYIQLEGESKKAAAATIEQLLDMKKLLKTATDITGKITDERDAMEVILTAQREIAAEAAILKSNAEADLERVRRYIGEKIFLEAMAAAF
jgi:hypothetical protein